MNHPSLASGHPAQSRLSLAFVAALALGASGAHAADGTWNVDANGTWSTPGNWASGTIADGSGSTANFTNEITGDRTVSLDTDREITNLVFGDSNTTTAGSWILNNNGTSTNNLILAGTTPTITVNALGAAKTATISAIIQGSAGLVKAGAGRLDLTGANTFTGGVTIKEGRLSVSGSSSSTTSANPIGTSAGTILLGDTTGSASAQVFGASTSGTYIIANAMTVQSGSAGTKEFGAYSNSVTYSGAITLNDSASFRHLGGTGTLTSSGGITVASGKTLTLNPNGGTLITISGAGGGILGDGAVTTVGSSSGTLSLTGNSTFSGGFTLGGSAVVVPGSSSTGPTGSPTASAFGTGIATLSGGNLRSTTGSDTTVSNALRLSGNITFPSVNGEKNLTLSGPVAIKDSSRTLTVNIDSGTLNSNGTGGASGKSLVISGAIDDEGNGYGITKSGTGEIILSGSNTFSGATTVSTGRLTVSNILALQNSAFDTTSVAGSTTAGLKTTVTTLTFGGLTGGNDLASRFMTTGGGYDTVTALTLNPQSGSVSYSGVIADGAAGMTLTKTGAGTQELSAANTFTGGVTIKEGRLSVSGSSTSTNSANPIGSSAGTILLGDTTGSANASVFAASTSGTYTIANALTVQSGSAGTKEFGAYSNSVTYSGAITLNDSASFRHLGGTGTLTSNGGISVASGKTLTLNPNTGSTIAISGTEAISGSGAVTTIGSSSGQVNLTSNSTFSGGFTMGGSATLLILGSSEGSANDPTKGAFGTGTATLAGGSIRSNTGSDTTIHNTLNLSGTITGVTVGSEKSLIFTGTGTLTGNTTFASAIGSTVSGSSMTFSGNIGDEGNGYGITKSAAGVLVLSGTNNYTGLTTVNGGELRIANAGAIGGANVTVTSGQLTMDGGITISGKSLTTSGSGTNFVGGLQSISGTNEWSGSVVLGADNSRMGARKDATLVVSGVIDDGADTFNLVVRNETKSTSNNGAGNSTTITELSGENTYGGNTQLIAGITRLEGGDNRLPTGTILQFGASGINAKFDMNGQNQQVAGLAVTNTVNDNGRDWNANELTNSSATLSTLTVNTASDQTFGLTPTSFTGSGNYTGIITGNVALEKTGTAELTLSGANTYTGATTVNGGTLVINGNNSGATGTITVSAGTVTGTPVATLAGSGTGSNGTIGGNVVLAAESASGFKNGGVLAPTAAENGTKLSVAGTTTFGAGSIFEWNMSAAEPTIDPGAISNSGNYGQLAGTGSITGSNAVFNIKLGSGNAFSDAFWNSDKSWTNVFSGSGATINLSSIFSSISGSGITYADDKGTVDGRGYFTFNGASTLNWTAVPEPTSALAGLLLGAGLLRRRRRD